MPTRRSSPPRRKSGTAAGKGPRPAVRGPETEIARLVDLLDRSWSGPAWHGPSVLESLAGVTAVEAERRPIAASHSIGELVLHMATWKRAVAMRLSGRPYSPSEAENFPPFSARSWRAAQAALRREHARLRRAFVKLRPARLAQPAVPGGSPVYLQAHGAVQHDLWHAGQILVLRRALERPAGSRNQS